jgi:hypothetical protein
MTGHSRAYRRPKPEHGVEGLGVDKVAFLLKGPIMFSNWRERCDGEPGTRFNPLQDARGRPERLEGIPQRIDGARDGSDAATVAFWNYDQGMEEPSGRDSARVIKDMGLARNKAEEALIDEDLAFWE